MKTLNAGDLQSDMITACRLFLSEQKKYTDHVTIQRVHLYD